MRHRPMRLWALLLGLAACICSAQTSWGQPNVEPAAPAFDPAALEFFENEVRPILVRRCHECHAAGDDAPKGNLRLDSREAVLKGGDTGPAMVPGQPEQSLLIDAINYGDTYQMPPKSKLPAAEIAVLTKWVALGAPWPAADGGPAAKSQVFDLAARKAAHWCWQPVSERPLPAVRQSAWPQQDLDHFILARLEESGLSPAPAADKRTLIRRAYFDLIGLPPTPEEVSAFLADESPEALATVVDRLLDSPHFGERWARHWLDLTRYAETFGHEFDYPIEHAYKYRDYVIRALNADVPYDRFVLEHVAGDLLTPPRLHPTDGYNESVLGTGFWWFGEATHAPVDVHGDEANRIDNQLDVFGKTFLGLTIGCARCHDHKFDAISTKDYYALAGYLQSSRRNEAFLDRHGQVAAAAAQLREIKRRGDTEFVAELTRATPGGADVARYLLAARESQLAGATETTSSAIAAQHGLEATKLVAWINALQQDSAQQPSHPLYAWTALAKTGTPEAFADFQQRLINDSRQRADFESKYPLLTDFDSFEGWFSSGEAFGDEPTQPREWDAASPLCKMLPAGMADSGRWSPRLQGVLRSPTFTVEHPYIYYRIRGQSVKIRLILDSYFMDVFSGLLFRGCAFDVNTDGKFVWHQQGQDVGRYLGHRGYIEILDHGDGSVQVDEIRFSDQGPPPELLHPLASILFRDQPRSLEALAQAYGSAWDRAFSGSASGMDASLTDLANWAAEQNLWQPDAAAQANLAQAREALHNMAVPAPDRVLSLTEGMPENEHVFIRGNHRLLGEEVPRQFLTALIGQPQPISSGSGRLELAQQVVDATNPLTARVLVNRLWHHVFGRGIVASTDNFGVLGDAPTHHELLDYLALRFMREGWSIKTALREMLLSSTYQMSSVENLAAAQVDPQNLLLHHARIRRLEGEAIRDAMLSISGRLDRTLYGPSVPVHITPFMQGRGKPGSSGPLDGNGRRSLYTEVRRNFLPPMMLAFDMPIPFNTIGKRNVSNVPAQALTMMNDPLVVQQAQQWAKRVLEADASATREQRIQSLYVAALARPADEHELHAASAFLDQQAAELGLSAEQVQRDERVWADLCHVLMNVKEFVFLK